MSFSRIFPLCLFSAFIVHCVPVIFLNILTHWAICHPTFLLSFQGIHIIDLCIHILCLSSILFRWPYRGIFWSWFHSISPCWISSFDEILDILLHPILVYLKHLSLLWSWRPGLAAKEHYWKYTFHQDFGFQAFNFWNRFFNVNFFKDQNCFHASSILLLIFLFILKWNDKFWNKVYGFLCRNII